MTVKVGNFSGKAVASSAQSKQPQVVITDKQIITSLMIIHLSCLVIILIVKGYNAERLFFTILQAVFTIAVHMDVWGIMIMYIIKTIYYQAEHLMKWVVEHRDITFENIDIEELLAVLIFHVLLIIYTALWVDQTWFLISVWREERNQKKIEKEEASQNINSV